jgi:AraC family transcriptional regulator
VSGSDIVANTSRGWNRDPTSVVRGATRNGVSAALWKHDAELAQEVNAQPDDETHILSLMLGAHRADLEVDGRMRAADRRLPAGVIQLVRAGERPRGVLYGRYEILHIYVPAQLIATTLERACGLLRSPVEVVDPLFTHDPIVEGLGREVLGEMLGADPLCQLRIDLLGQDIAIQLLRRWSTFTGAPGTFPLLAKGGLAPWQVKRIMEYLEDRLADDVGLDDLSRLVDLSTFHLCRAFKQSTGMPPHRWRMQRRVERAREMLEGTDLTVTAIAAAVGFDDPSGFASAFRKVTGTSPSAYRRERRR